MGPTLNELHAAFGDYVVFPFAAAHNGTVLWCAATRAHYTV
jgi:hypothetical protein